MGHKEKRIYFNEFLIGGFVFLLTEWINKGCIETPEEMVQLYMVFLANLRFKIEV
ncbi:MAG: TetR family transcriptional regulator C-terminal domain-containing protein [Clostridia bacterium]|nr:TetR family transcriptional regulator C-terminal domain-containing protein [Clostridia bacterium]